MKHDPHSFFQDNPRILDMDSGKRLLKRGEEWLVKAGLKPVIDHRGSIGGMGLKQSIRECLVILTGNTPVPDHLVQQADRCNCILLTGSDSPRRSALVNISLARRSGIYVAGLTDYASDFISGRLIDWILKTTATNFREHKFRKIRIGILGLGRVGGKVAAKALARRFDVLAHDPYIKREKIHSPGIRCVSVEDLFGISDVITLHVPVNESTINMISGRELYLMKRDAVLINISGPELMNMSALKSFLSSGKEIEYHYTAESGCPNGPWIPDIQSSKIKPINPTLFLPEDLETLRYQNAMRIIIELLKGIRPGNLLADPAFPRHEMFISHGGYRASVPEGA
jgi:hypothetical protein